MSEFLNSLTWPAAFAVVGSVATFVLGVLQYLNSIRKQSAAPTQTGKQSISESIYLLQENISSIVDDLSSIETKQDADLQTVHHRISDSKERLAHIEGDIREINGYIKSMQQQITDHEQRDIRDFKAIQEKMDKLTDIVIQILQD